MKNTVKNYYWISMLILLLMATVSRVTGDLFYLEITGFVMIFTFITHRGDFEN